MEELAEQELLPMIQSWENLAVAIRYISDHPEHLDGLMKLALDDSEIRNWRAAWMVDRLHDKYPELILPYLPSMTDFVLTTQNTGKKRHLLKLISQHEIPEDRMGELLNFCIEIFSSAHEPVAVRVHAMQILYNIALKEPGFAGELIELIEHEIEFHGSAGILSRGRKLLKKLIRLTNPLAVPWK